MITIIKKIKEIKPKQYPHKQLWRGPKLSSQCRGGFSQLDSLFELNCITASLTNGNTARGN